MESRGGEGEREGKKRRPRREEARGGKAEGRRAVASSCLLSPPLLLARSPSRPADSSGRRLPPSQRQARIKDLFHEADADFSHALDPVELKQFLKSYAKTEVTDATVEYVLMVVSGVSGAHEISEDDVATAVGTWEALASDQEVIT